LSTQNHPSVQDYWRYELKYRLSQQDYWQVRNAIYPFIACDQYTKVAPSRKYLVRSLYFDTPDFQAYNEKLGGNHSRLKFRIRAYTDCVSTNSPVHVEAKIRNGARSQKIGAFVSVEQYLAFMQGFHWDGETNSILIEFERSVHARILRPKILVQYRREAYVSRARDDIRITFDHAVQSAQTKTLFPEHVFFHPHYAHSVILEIKHRDQQPYWLKDIVQTYSLKIEPNSKYCQGIDVTQLDLVNHALRV